jgi:hypothetical protein
MKKNNVKTFIYFNPPIGNLLWDKKRVKEEISLLEKLAKIPVINSGCVSRFIEVDIERPVHLRRYAAVTEFGKPADKEDLPHSNPLNTTRYMLTKKGPIQV